MNRVALSARRRATVAIVFLCMAMLALCQILGPTARLAHDFRPALSSEPGLVTMAAQTGAAHSPLPSRCAAIKFVPVEIGAADLEPAEAACELVATATSTAPWGIELAIPTPPPRRS